MVQHRENELFVSDEDRYSRLRLISWWRQERLAEAKILVVGAGALGNEVLKNLALVGIGRIFVVDYDTIDDSNLSRSVLFRSSDAGRLKVEVAGEMIRQINPDVRLHTIAGNIMTDVGLGLFREMDTVIGCLDNREARLWVNRCCWKVGIPWVDGGIQEISGVVKVFQPPDSACYECGMSENDYKLINLKYSCPLLKREDIMEGKVPTAPTISSIVAGLQSQEALKLIHELPVRAGAALVFSGESNNVYTTAYQRKPSCLSHETYPAPKDLDLKAEETTLARFFESIRADVGTEPILHLDRDLLSRLICRRCEIERSVMAPLSQVSMSDARCEECGELCETDIVYSLKPDERFLDRTLLQLGVPPYDILKVASGTQVHFFRLVGDRKSYFDE